MTKRTVHVFVISQLPSPAVKKEEALQHLGSNRIISRQQCDANRPSTLNVDLMDTIEVVKEEYVVEIGIAAQPTTETK